MPPSRRRLFRLATGRSTADRDLDDEMRLHLELRAAELMAEGWSAEAARGEALRRFGDPSRIRGSVRRIDEGRHREMRRAEWWDELTHDLRYAVRTLARQPGFTAAAVLTLAFGVGATTAILSIVNGVIVRPLPYPNAERVMQIWQTGRPGTPLAGRTLPFSAANFADLRAGARTFERVAALRSWRYTLTEGGEAELVPGARVSVGVFEALGVAPRLGRSFTPADEQLGAERVAILSDGLWRRRFGADPGALGRPITLNGERFTVTGVMPRGFSFPRGADLPAGFQFGAHTDVWTPMVMSPGELAFRGALNIVVIGLPRVGTTPAAARADLGLVMGRLEEQYPEANTNMSATGASLQGQVVAEVRPALLVLLGAVGFLLLIACVNVSNLLLTRTAARYREVAVRTALGAGRGRLLRQFVTENLLLALGGGALGVGVAMLGKNALLALAPANLPRLDDVTIDWRVLAGILAIVVVVGLVFGVLVAREVVSADHIEGLREGSKGSGGRSRRRLRHGLVVLEVALSVVLLAGAGALGRTFLNLRSVEPGFRTDSVLTAKVSLPLLTSDFRQILRLAPGWARFYRQLTDHLAARPGIRGAGVVSTLPLSGAWERAGFQVEGRPPLEPGQEQSALYAGVSDGYFQAIGIPLVSGRRFDARDRDSTAAVVIVSEAMARRYWPGRTPVGERISAFLPKTLEIVGVVGDVRAQGVGSEPSPTMYFPLSVYAAPTMWLVVGSAGDPAGQRSVIREAVRAIDPRVPLTDVATMEEVLAGSLAQQRFSATLIGAFALAALGLAVLGLYGVVSFGVARRSREIGVRLALGAEPGGVLRMVLREGLALSLVGVAIGIGFALALGRLLSDLMFGVSPTDPYTLAGACLLLIGVALVGSVLPARRAMRVDPVLALREE